MDGFVQFPQVTVPYREVKWRKGSTKRTHPRVLNWVSLVGIAQRGVVEGESSRGTREVKGSNDRKPPPVNPNRSRKRGNCSAAAS